MTTKDEITKMIDKLEDETEEVLAAIELVDKEEALRLAVAHANKIEEAKMKLWLIEVARP